MKRLPHHNRGFALIIALALTGLLAVVVLILTRAMAADLRRTAEGQVQQQLDELLLAGQVVVHSHLAAAAATTVYTPIPLPALLAAHDARLAYRITQADQGQIRATVTAQIGPAATGQTLIYQNTPAGWSLRDATLDGASVPSR
jgi:hypothetical protein